MKGYHEYLELHGYFAGKGAPKLSRVEFDSAEKEYASLAAGHPELSREERGRLAELKALLFRDKP